MPLETDKLYDRIKTALGLGNPSEIARKLDLTPQSVYLWQKGKLPGIETIAAIADSSDTSIHWLLTGKGPQKVSAGIEASNTDREPVEALHDLLAEDFADIYEKMAQEWRLRTGKTRKRVKSS